MAIVRASRKSSCATATSRASRRAVLVVEGSKTNFADATMKSDTVIKRSDMFSISSVKVVVVDAIDNVASLLTEEASDWNSISQRGTSKKCVKSTLGVSSASGGIIVRREMTSLNDTGDGSAADGGGSIGRGSSTMVMMILFFVCDEFVLD